MSYINRRRLEGKVEELYNDILENVHHVYHYSNPVHFSADYKLGIVLGSWLEYQREASKYETKVDGIKEIRTRKKR